MIKKLIFTFVLLLLSLLLAAVLAAAWYIRQPLPLPQQPFEFTVKPGSSVTAIARDLKAQGLIEYEQALVLLARATDKDTRLKAGRYQLTQSVTPPQLLDKMSQGDIMLHKLQVIEGWTFKQFRQQLYQHPDIESLTKDWSDQQILQELDLDYPHSEGLFFPDTYVFAAGSSDLQILKKAYHSMQQKLQSAWQNRQEDLPLSSPYEALILASIIEKETGQEADRAQIAGVFINRLRRGMLLQTDPTVIYGLGAQFDGNLRRKDLRTDTPYNTYTRGGLPPTPIALPGMASIQAAVNPADTSALYFVARGDGTTQFSDTLRAHNRAVNQYQR